MKNKTILLFFALIFLVSSCSSKDSKLTQSSMEENKATIENEFEYSNINDEQTKEKLRKLMEKSNFSQENINRFFLQVDFFNQAIESEGIVDEITRANPIVEYDVYKMQDKLMEKYPDFTGINCRLTAFGLISDKISIKDTSNPNKTTSLIDESSLTKPTVDILREDEIDKFHAFYTTIDTENKNDKTYQLEKIKNEWTSRNINIEDNENYSLISVYVFSNLEEDKNEIFIGHTGIAFFQEDGKILFLEKLAFTAPYQATSFNSKNDLYNYLMNMYDDSSENYPLKPIIFENSEEMKI